MDRITDSSAHRLIGSSASTPSISRRLRSTRTRPPRSPIPSSWPPPLLAFDSSRVPRRDHIRRPDFHPGTPASRPCVAGARRHIPCTGAVPPMVGLDFPAPGSWAGRTREVRWTRPYSFRLGMSRTPWKPGFPRRRAGELQLQSIRQASIFSRVSSRSVKSDEALPPAPAVGGFDEVVVRRLAGRLKSRGVPSR